MSLSLLELVLYQYIVVMGGVGVEMYYIHPLFSGESFTYTQYVYTGKHTYYKDAATLMHPLVNQNERAFPITSNNVTSVSLTFTRMYA
jgi:hypothetical protein